jgi:hypothetical protein
MKLILIFCLTFIKKQMAQLSASCRTISTNPICKNLFLSIQIYEMKQYYTAIIFFMPAQEITPRKYRNITNIKKFKFFAASSGGYYFNYYDKATKEYKGRIYC